MKVWWWRLGSYALPHWAGLGLILLLTALSIGLETLQPWPLKLIVDSLLKSQPLPPALNWLTALPGATANPGLLAWLAGTTILLFWSRQAIAMLQSYLKTGVASRLTYGLATVLFAHLQRLSLIFHSRQPTGDLVRRVTTDSSCASELVLGVWLSTLTSLATLVAMFAVMWQLDPPLALLAIAIAPFLGWLIRVFDRPMAERTYQYQQLEGEMMSLAEQSLAALPIVQAFTREQREEERFRHLSRRSLRAYLRAILSQLQFKVGIETVTALGRLGVMIVGGFHVLAGQLTVGSLLVFFAYLASLYTPMESLAYLSVISATSAAKGRRVLELLDVAVEVQDLPGAKPLPTAQVIPNPQNIATHESPPTPLTSPTSHQLSVANFKRNSTRGHVCLEAVSFGYEAGQPILQGISLEARPGETVALVGTTGAGKSTLLSLIPRLFDPWEGRVLLDGRDVRQIQLQSLRGQVALLLQEPFLLPLTVAENIAYGRWQASREEIVAAAVAAHADEFIRQLPQGYDTVLGERAATLSGGQRQRLAIARALLKDAPVLLLDEPTSALDAQTEALLLDALERLRLGRTTFIIAHRLSTIRQATRIAVIEQGQVVEMGSHQELLAGRGHYYRLYRKFGFNI